MMTTKIIRRILLTAAFCLPMTAAADVKPRIYLNTGHGGWGSNDRHMTTI